MVEKNPDQQAAEHRRQAAERVAEAHRAGTDVGREQLALIRVVTETQPRIAERDHDAAQDQARGAGLKRKQAAEDHRPQS
ncbi:hypothetical protein APX70_200330 [Pseudomonas syringae pv. maculicola]|uniref:Uncharacterized protein n=1 Tax=Pseudomonas syringae pv. maculicola TaxID=59511 RepID=A0A3M3A9H6_PSEYM|nr:hypothetical protein APX70_200330 [Pseudomonas syringae pv. maculicola]